MTSSTMIHAPISVAELLDKITILEIKLEHAQEVSKRENILTERKLLASLVPSLDQDVQILVSDLKTVNQTIWDSEDRIRIKHRNNEFDQEFIDLARTIYLNNDQRAAIKRQINQLTQSAIFEEKVY